MKILIAQRGIQCKQVVDLEVNKLEVQLTIVIIDKEFERRNVYEAIFGPQR